MENGTETVEAAAKEDMEVGEQNLHRALRDVNHRIAQSLALLRKKGGVDRR